MLHRSKSKLFMAMGLVGLLAVLIGFSTTFIIPLSKGTFKAPVTIYVHGFLAFCWIVLFITQTFLIQKANAKLHMRLGQVAIFLAVGITITLIPVALYQIDKDTLAGMGEAAVSSIVGTLTSGVLFLSLVIAAILKKRQPETHKRLMLLATLVLLWPAWFRFRHFFPSVTHPEIWFAVVLADSFIVISILLDRLLEGKFNRTLLIVGIAIIAEHLLELIAYDSAPWRALASGLYSLFG